MDVNVLFRRAFTACILTSLPCLWCAAQQSTESRGPSFHLELTVDRVLVPVVVRDAKGHLIDGLTKEDFQVLDDGKPRAIVGFMEQKWAPVETQAELMPESSHPPQTPPVSTSPSPTLPDRITVFLFDDTHLDAEDLAHAREAGLKVLSGALRGTDMAAVVSISGRVNTGLTRDPEKLQDALAKLKPLGIYHSDSMDCPFIDYYQADLIENKHDPVAIQDANRKFANCNPAVSQPQDVGGGANLPTAENLVEASASRALNIGRQDVQSTFASIAQLLGRMAPLPGQRTLILVSSGFLNIERDSMNWESQVIDLAVKSNVTISALDARGLYTTEITASQHSPALSGQSLQVNSEYRRSAMTLAENAMAELADGTGGTYFHNSNDLVTGLKELTVAPACMYLLELPLDGVKRNGSYHRLKVKVDRKGLQLEARRGYFVPKLDKSKKRKGA